MCSKEVVITQPELKRLAIQIAAQLPPRQEDALTVLEYAETLVTGFLSDNVPSSD